MGGRVLVLEPHPIARREITRILESDGLEVRAATSEAEGWLLLDQERVDVVLLAAELDGGALAGIARIQGRYLRKKTPVLVTAAGADDELAASALERGASDFLPRPYNPRLVRARVRAQLQAAGTPASEGPCEPTEIAPGTVLGGKYAVGEALGAGGYGTVFRGHHVHLEQPVAIKVLHASVARTPAKVRRFQLEGANARRVQHPNVVQVYDFGVAPGGVPYLVMELLHGHSLADELDELPRGQRLGLVRILEILGPVCDMLEAAHAEGLMHRDIKPANIFLHRVRGTEVVKVLDFGVSKLLGSGEHLTDEGDVVGTPQYTAPERLGTGPVDERADIYGLGVVLYELLSGRLHYTWSTDQPVQVAVKVLNEEPVRLELVSPDVPGPLVDLVMRMLERNPAARPTLREVKATLARGAVEWAEWMAPALEGTRPADRDTPAYRAPIFDPAATTLPPTTPWSVPGKAPR